MKTIKVYTNGANMKPYFLEPIHNVVKYGKYDIVNHIVNISLCKGIEKFQEKYYPDNEGIPALKFKGCDIRWIFPNKNERQKEINRILEMFSFN
jgi:hypothetical protein